MTRKTLKSFLSKSIRSITSARLKKSYNFEKDIYQEIPDNLHLNKESKKRINNYIKCLSDIIDNKDNSIPDIIKKKTACKSKIHNNNEGLKSAMIKYNDNLFSNIIKKIDKDFYEKITGLVYNNYDPYSGGKINKIKKTKKNKTKLK